MAEETNMTDSEKCCKNKKYAGGAGAAGGLFGLGFIGALVFYIQHAGTFLEGVVGFLKALVWPALLVYKLLEFLLV